MAFHSTDKGILYLHPYYPKRYVEHSGVSESIIAFKQGYQIPIDTFAKEMKEALLEQLGNDTLQLQGRCLVVVPSHLAGKWGRALLQVAKKLCQELNMLDYSCALERVAEHEKLTAGGDRSIDSHIATMKLNPAFDVNGKKVIVFDDVTTTGNSLLAAARILRSAGADRVSAITIGKTFEGTYPSAF